jgi:predicted GIY-YIG superfamily endonuclease
MFVVYILLLEENRIYVGMTQKWRIDARYAEHTNPNCKTTKWTSKYPPLEKVWVSEPFACKVKCCKFEHDLTKRLMRLFGLDAVRGGNFVMAKEGGTWWVRKTMQDIPRFTQLWAETTDLRELRTSHFRM